jgi:RHS repeat-associated protein
MKSEAITPLITTPSGGKRFRISDHLASLRVEIGPSGTGHYDYDPWGKLTQLSGTGSSRLTYNDHEQDLESGDLNLGVRQDDGDEGRFNSVDALWSSHPVESPYVYTSNNPLRYTDPTGMQARTVQVPFEEGGEEVPTGGRLISTRCSTQIILRKSNGTARPQSRKPRKAWCRRRVRREEHQPKEILVQEAKTRRSHLRMGMTGLAKRITTVEIIGPTASN